MTAGDWKSKFMRWLAEGRLPELLPEVACLEGVPQPQEYHPEGDAFNHTLLAVESVADGDDERVFWAVLLHDIGKRHVTEFLDGRWRAHGHDRIGAEMAPAILQRFGLEALADDVCWLIRHHQYELSWRLAPGQELSPRQEAFTKKELFPLLQKVCAADRAGRGTACSADENAPCRWIKV